MVYFNFWFAGAAAFWMSGETGNYPTPGGCVHPSVAVRAMLCQNSVVSKEAWGGGILLARETHFSPFGF